MKILVLGDSTTFGAELSDLPPIQCFGKYGDDLIDSQGNLYHSKPSSLAYPSLLGEKFNCEISNESIIGGSNDRIFRLAITRTANEHWDLVICAWTSLERFDLTDGHKDIAVSMINPWEYNWVKEYIKHHWDPIRQDYNFIVKLLALQSYFKQKNQRYVYVNSSNINIHDHKLWNEIDNNKWISWKTDFYSWTADYPKGPSGHVLEQGHAIIADIIFDAILQIYPELANSLPTTQLPAEGKM